MFNAIDMETSSNLKDPFLSIVIPTRERSATLKFTLKTALDQTDGDYEIVVSDNFSQDETERVVLEFQDPRIKYVNTGRRLSMSDNYEFAAKNVRSKSSSTLGMTR
jgi:glycosyltransferase involved in cell wall biosynthesis